ncbi:sulfite exporter TauE/SafE family protein [Falsiroseomonas oryziterrae]|uniref:sulfite exporter TauE/SafE family protein n=1 Tax=Falsiroseomonas oryziterrae TaxID=2911368 RepID=UPI001F1A7028|nr:sulfite exporter TauE/SafE family protein [Roseomonas sp. NPKOSM-4]
MIEPLAAIGVGLASYATAIVGGLAGYGTNLLMPLALAPVVGAAAAIPILAVSGLFNNASRLVVFRDKVEWRPVLPLTLAAIPACFVGAALFTLLSGPQVALLLGVTLVGMVPLRRWLKRRRLNIGPAGIVAIGACYGLVTGGTPGGGVLLTAALAALGLPPQAVVATDAAISLVIGLVKVGTFQAFGELPLSSWVMALMIGLIAIPGVMTARWISSRISVTLHTTILDAAILTGGAVLALRGLGLV